MTAAFRKRGGGRKERQGPLAMNPRAKKILERGKREAYLVKTSRPV